MRRLALPLAAGALLAIAGLGIVSLMRPGAAPVAATLAAELRCPDCEGLSVAESPTRSASEMRRQIDELIAQGRTADEVRQHFVARYGEWILLAPRSPLPWIAPLVLLLVAIGAFALWLRGRRRAPAVEHAPLRTDAARRVADEAEALDA